MNHVTIVVENHIVTINGKRAKRFYTLGSRLCYVSDGIIVKLNDEGALQHLHQSSRELRIWEHIINDGDKRYFQKPIAGQIRGNGWIAQRFVKFRRGRKPGWAWKLAEKLSDKYGILKDCRESDGSFVYGFNWGITEDGQFVIYDWGF